MEWFMEKFIGSGMSYALLGVIIVALVGIIKKKVPNKRIEQAGAVVGQFVFGLAYALGEFCKHTFNTLTGFGKMYLGNKAWGAIIELLEDTAIPFYIGAMKPWRDKIKVNIFEYCGAKIKEGIALVTSDKVKTLIAENEAKKLLRKG